MKMFPSDANRLCGGSLLLASASSPSRLYAGGTCSSDSIRGTGAFLDDRRDCFGQRELDEDESFIVPLYCISRVARYACTVFVSQVLKLAIALYHSAIVKGRRIR